MLVPRQLECSCRPAEVGASRAKAVLAEIYNAEDRDHALNAVKAFEADYGAKWPKAVAKITEHLDVLLAFYDYPAEHWIHLRTTNPIESTFATVRLRSGHQGTRLPRRRNRDGVQAHRVRPGPLACRERTTPGRPRRVQAPASRRANSSNDPTNPEVTSKSRDTPIDRSDDD